MVTDVFNNPSNDYISPGLSPCVGVPDGNSGDFKFIDDGVGVTVGSDIALFMDLSDINIHVTAWTSEKKTLQSGEVIYVPGLEKGLLYKKQVFDIPSDFNETNQEYYFIIDLSVSYYNNFKYYNINLEASSNYSQNLDIDDALNIAFGNKGIKVGATYDPSIFTFAGTQKGYDFDISNVTLTLIDSSTDSTSPFPDSSTYTLSEDASSALPAMKYPNGAMLGYMLKVKYPSTECYRDYWINMNHVSSPMDVFEEIIIDSSTYYEKFTKKVEVGMSGSGDEKTLSAGDYLDYINSNDMWFKVGKFASRFTAPDHPDTAEKNLIGGFYLFNPQTFIVNIEYMLLNRIE
jgi:hypothetical protein